MSSECSRAEARGRLPTRAGRYCRSGMPPAVSHTLSIAAVVLSPVPPQSHRRPPPHRQPMSLGRGRVSGRGMGWGPGQGQGQGQGPGQEQVGHKLPQWDGPALFQ